MKTTLRFLCVALLLTAVPLALAEGEDKQIKKRGKIDERSSAILDEVLGESAKAKELYGKAIGYAIFDNTKVALGLSGGGGSGVAVDKASGTRTYMKMGSGGVGLGIGVEDLSGPDVLREREGVRELPRQAAGRATPRPAPRPAAAGAAAKTTFHNGMAVFVRTKKGPDGQRRRLRNQVLAERPERLGRGQVLA